MNQPSITQIVDFAVSAIVHAYRKYGYMAAFDFDFTFTQMWDVVTKHTELNKLAVCREAESRGYLICVAGKWYLTQKPPPLEEPDPVVAKWMSQAVRDYVVEMGGVLPPNRLSMEDRMHLFGVAHHKHIEHDNELARRIEALSREQVSRYDGLRHDLDALVNDLHHEGIHTDYVPADYEEVA